MGVQGDTFAKRTGAIRKNCRSLTAAEIALYVNGVLALKKSGEYDKFVQLHVDAMKPAKTSVTSAAHGGPVFLPWHRRFLLEFELAMGNVLGDPNYAVPYWDWTQDSGHEMAAVVWEDQFLGGGGWPVENGPFATHTKWEAWAQPPMTADLTRECGGRFPPPPPPPPTTTTNPSTTAALPPPSPPSTPPPAPPLVALPTADEVNRIMNGDLGPYDVAPWTTGAGAGFRNMLEGFLRPPLFKDPKNEPPRRFFLHTWVHLWVGGHMGYGYSPTDPIFFLHHSLIDRLWARWQFLSFGRWGYDGVPTDDTVPPGHRRGSPMLSGFDPNGVGIPWTSDLGASHPNPEDWDVHENFRYRYDDEQTWHRTVCLRPATQPQDWLTAVSGPSPPVTGHLGWQTVVLRPGSTASTTKARSVSIQVAMSVLQTGLNPRYYPQLDPTTPTGYIADGNPVGYASPGQPDAATFYLTVKTEPIGGTPTVQGQFTNRDGDYLLASNGQVTIGSDTSAGAQWFVLDPRVDGGERVVCYHTAFTGPCNQLTRCYIDNHHCLILEDNQRVVCYHRSFQTVGGAGPRLNNVVVNCNCTYVDGAHCIVLPNDQMVVCYHNDYKAFGGPTCNCGYIDGTHVQIVNTTPAG